jgi:hypothetical protein
MTTVATRKRAVRPSRKDGGKEITVEERVRSTNGRSKTRTQEGSKRRKASQEKGRQVQAQGTAEEVVPDEITRSVVVWAALTGGVSGIASATVFEILKWRINRWQERQELAQGALLDIVSTLRSVKITLSMISTTREPRTESEIIDYPRTWLQTPPVLDREKYVLDLGDPRMHRHAISFFDALGWFATYSTTHAAAYDALLRENGILRDESRKTLNFCREEMIRNCKKMLKHGWVLADLLYAKASQETRSIASTEYDIDGRATKRERELHA